MELNKSPPLWDWEDLLFSPSRAAPKKMSLLDFEVEAINGFEAGSGSGGSGILETSHSFSQDLSCRKELESACPTRTPSMTDISIGSGESLMGLNLGKRTYFEDMLGGNNSSKMAKVKRSKPSSQSTEVPRCQVEGCNLDLSSDKVYHRKHRVCVTHSKSSKVIIRGLERRFCQQCSRFHNLSEFDQKKRSCRRRLLDHNARRRKPKPEIIQFNTMPLHSSLHEGRNQISFGFNQVPMVQTRPDINSKLIKGRVGLSSPTKIGCSDELQGTWYKPQESDFKFAYGCTQPWRMREVPVQGFHQGVQVPMTMSDIDATQDLRALSLLSSYSSGSCVPERTPQQLGLHYSNHDLSLLSTKSWGSFELDPIPPTAQQSSMLQYHHDRRLGLPEYGQQSISSGSGVEVPTIQSSTQSQQFQLKELNEPSFYMY